MAQTIAKYVVTPENTPLETLSPSEIDGLFMESNHYSAALLDRLALAVLVHGEERDDVKTLLEIYKDFNMEVARTAGGIEIRLYNAPAEAFVAYEELEDEKPVVTHGIIEGIRQNLFAVLRDMVFVRSEVERTGKFDMSCPEGITDAVFLILRNAGIFDGPSRHKTVVCWGGHAIRLEEYDYTKEVGYQCGLRKMDVITGCGPGAMKGPMKGATIAHSKQRIGNGRYIGITEPGIISSEAPNPIVDPLVIMPDIEKRLEAFVRLGHGVVIFPGGAGTAEELMYILGVLSHPDNRDMPFPLILTGPESSARYFHDIDAFLKATLGEEVTNRYQLILGDPDKVAMEMNKGILEVRRHREKTRDSYYYNRGLFIPPVFQEHFVVTHESVAGLEVRGRSETYAYAATLRRVFSAVVEGNVKPDGIRAVEEKGPFRVTGDAAILAEIDRLLQSFVEDGRMRLTGVYKPCYEIVK